MQPCFFRKLNDSKEENLCAIQVRTCRLTQIPNTKPGRTVNIAKRVDSIVQPTSEKICSKSRLRRTRRANRLACCFSTVGVTPFRYVTANDAKRPSHSEIVGRAENVGKGTASTCCQTHRRGDRFEVYFERRAHCYRIESREIAKFL